MKKYKLVTDDTHSKTLVGGNFNNTSKMQNPKWPPTAGKIIIAKAPNYKETFIGKVFQNIWNNTASVLLLMNNKDYIEETLRSNEIVSGKHGGRGLFLLLPSYNWQYVTSSGLDKIVQLYGNLDSVKDVNVFVKEGYDKFINTTKQQSSYLPVKSSDVNTSIASINHIGYYDDIDKTVDTKCKNNEHNIKDSNLLSRNDIDADTLFQEKALNVIINNKNEERNLLDPVVKKLINDKLKLFEIIDEEESKIIVNENISINNLMKDIPDFTNEGDKIIKWVKENFSSKVKKEDGITSMFSDLKQSIYNGYVYFTRGGIDVDDKVTSTLVPNLQHFTWQYNIPIDYNTLKYVLFQNKFQKTIKQDNEQQKEAEKILSQEYIVALQPEPKYQLWCLKRLLMCWYSDEILDNNIRKIKIIINQWRCRNDQKYNTQNGILPSIVIYPKYGQASARLVISQLSYYFSLYKNVGWICSTPSYFIKANTLIYYTNGSLDLKLYFRKAKENSNMALDNDTFSSKYTKITDYNAIMHPMD